MKFIKGLELKQPWATLGSLAAYADFQFAELCRFRQIYQLEIEDTITGTKLFPGEMLFPKKINVSLPNDVYNILVEYYNAAYDLEFLSIADLAWKNTKTIGRSVSRFVVRP